MQNKTMNDFEMLILDYANFSGSQIAVSFLAIKLSKTTREIKFLQKSEPWEFHRYLKQYQKELDFIKPIKYPSLPINWYEEFVRSGGLTMINGEALPSLSELNNQNNVF